MHQIPGTINNRKILYLDIIDDLKEFESLPLQNWALLIIADSTDFEQLHSFAELSIDKDVLYVSAAGAAASQIDDLFDMAMVMRTIEESKLPSWYKSEDDVLMTTWHSDIENGLWFITNAAHYEDHLINTVVVANWTGEDLLPRITDLVNRIIEGWLPPD
jgi:hypothetical protein